MRRRLRAEIDIGMLSRYSKRPEEKKKKKKGGRGRRGKGNVHIGYMAQPCSLGWGEVSGKRHAENVAHGIECGSRLDGDRIDVPSGNALELGIRNRTQGKDSL